MKKRKKQFKILNILIITLIFLVLTLIFLFIRFTGYAIKQQQVQFYFYNEENNCSLNGYLFVGENQIGKTQNGFFNLTLEEYKNLQNNLNQNISLFGKLGDCFNENKDMLFDKFWKMPEIENDFFYGDSLFNFKTNINIHNPVNQELIGFIQPEKVKSYLSNIELKNNILEDLSKINIYLSNKIQYVNNSKAAYWQLPEETLSNNKGICNDYSTTLLSLFLAYSSSLKCYNIVLTDHVTTFCNIDNSYIYYDQQEKQVKKEIKYPFNVNEIKSQLSDLNREYLDYYGLDKNETARIAFNNKEYIEFKTSQDFIDWQYSLINKNSKSDIFLDLETKNNELEKNNNLTEQTIQGELGSQRPASPELPSLSGFLQKYSFLIFPLFIILIILIIILIKINKK